MAKFTKLPFCQKLILWHQTSSHKCSMCLYCVSKVSGCFSKLTLSLLKQNALKITNGNKSNRIGPWPLIQMFILWISMFCKFDEIPSLPLQNIKEKKQNVVDKEFQRAITLTDLAPSPYFSIINGHLVDMNVFTKSDEIPSLPVQVIKEKPKCHRL